MGSLSLQGQEHWKAWPCLAQGVFSDGSWSLQHSVPRLPIQEGCASPRNAHLDCSQASTSSRLRAFLALLCPTFQQE